MERRARKREMSRELKISQEEVKVFFNKKMTGVSVKFG
jgi:hypothetical protein